jgi:hypothetical protein
MKLGKVFEDVLKKVREQRKNHPEIVYRKKLPLLYVKLVFFGLALTGMQATFLPQMVACTSLFGMYACDPWGNFLVAFVSMPGYLFTGKIMSFWSNAPSYVFFLVLFSLSILLYYMLGLLLDRRSRGKTSLKSFTIFLVFTALLILLAMFFALI